IVTVLYRIAGQPKHSGNNPFKDIETGWYYDAVLWAYENGIVTGTSATTFAPNGDVTREQMATFLYRFAKYMGYDTSKSANLTTFPDASKVGSWAYDALAWANAKGLITGAKGSDGVNRLNPQGAATREQVATILMRFCQAYEE
ncbi:MAG: S-layer homology domain-containing protein, partial [Clostridia bacterium]|nr:S-layer homology domain-containing protein [Clostridia bacterium]